MLVLGFERYYERPTYLQDDTSERPKAVLNPRKTQDHVGADDDVETKVYRRTMVCNQRMIAVLHYK